MWSIEPTVPLSGQSDLGCGGVDSGWRGARLGILGMNRASLLLRLTTSDELMGFGKLPVESGALIGVCNLIVQYEYCKVTCYHPLHIRRLLATRVATPI